MGVAVPEESGKEPMFPAQLDKFTEAELRTGFRHQGDELLHVGGVPVATGHAHRLVHCRAAARS
jgi:hypothetical protein